MQQGVASRAWGRRLLLCLFFVVSYLNSTSREALASQRKPPSASVEASLIVDSQRVTRRFSEAEVKEEGRQSSASDPPKQETASSGVQRSLETLTPGVDSTKKQVSPTEAEPVDKEEDELLLWKMVKLEQRHVKPLLDLFKKTADYPYNMNAETLRKLMEMPLFDELSFLGVKIDSESDQAIQKKSQSEGEEEIVSAVLAFRDGDDVVLHSIFTAPEFRCFGVAPQMLEMLEDLANYYRNNGHSNVRRICADASVKYPATLINLKKLGFIIESHSKDSFAAGNHSGYSLFKELTPCVLQSLAAQLPSFSKIRLTSYQLAGNDVRRQVEQILDDAVFESLTGEQMTIGDFLANDPYFCDFSPLDFVRNSSPYFIVAVDDETLEVKGMLMPMQSTVNGVFRDFRVYADGMKTMSMLFEGMLNAAQSARQPKLEVQIPSDDTEMVELFTSLGFLHIQSMKPMKRQVYKLALRAEIPYKPLDSYRLTKKKLHLEDAVKVAIERIDRIRLLKKMRYVKFRDMDHKLEVLKRKRDEMEYRRELATDPRTRKRKEEQQKEEEEEQEEEEGQQQPKEQPDEHQQQKEHEKEQQEEQKPEEEQPEGDVGRTGESPSLLFHLEPLPTPRTERNELYRLKESEFEFIKAAALRTAETMLVALIFFLTLSWLLMLKKRQDRIMIEEGHTTARPKPRIRFRLGGQTETLPDFEDYEEVAVVEGHGDNDEVEEIVDELEQQEEARMSY